MGNEVEQRCDRCNEHQSGSGFIHSHWRDVCKLKICISCDGEVEGPADSLDSMMHNSNWVITGQKNVQGHRQAITCKDQPAHYNELSLVILSYRIRSSIDRALTSPSHRPTRTRQNSWSLGESGFAHYPILLGAITKSGEMRLRPSDLKMMPRVGTFGAILGRGASRNGELGMS